MSCSRKNAFTLIELLIVIAVIALLIAILVPALQSVREQARRVHCGTNIRNIGLGLINFASQNDDFLPPPQYSTGSSPWKAYMCYDQAKPQTPLQLAVLYKEGFVGDNARILYCPAVAEEYSTYTNTDGVWGTTFQDNCVRSAYLYAPQSKDKDPIGLPAIHAKPRLAELEQNSAIVTDKIDTWNNVAHQSAVTKGLNIVFIDGSVKFCHDASVMDFNLWHPYGASDSRGPGSSDLALRAILSSIKE